MLTETTGPSGTEAAATIWARARSRRDGEPTTAEDTTPGIRRRLAVEGATLLLVHRDGRPVGFTLFAPRTVTLEIFYLATDPDSWGTGVAAHLLTRAEDHARLLGRDTMELWVITDNRRAIAVYERAGWTATEEVATDPASGRIERRFVRNLGHGLRAAAAVR